MRSGTAAFYDQRVESGTVNISGPRSGCTNSVIPANGVLNVPYFYEGCTCSYPLPMALSLVSMPETFEQWMSWGEKPAEQLLGKIERLGVNFGAPGDRKTEDGTLWLDYPNVGGPSPELKITMDPAEPEFFYRHSLRMDGGEGWPWVAASGVSGLKSATLEGLKPGKYRVNLVFAAQDTDEPSFDVTVQSAELAKALNVAAEADGPMKALTKSRENVAIDDSGQLRLEFQGQSSLSGLEMIRTSD